MSDSVEKLINGAGGDAPEAREPVDAANTLRSRSVYRVAGVLSEGECGGLIDGMKSVELDDVPVENSDGTFNFEGVDLQFRTGAVSQTPVDGIVANVANSVAVNTLLMSGVPQYRDPESTESESVYIMVTVPALNYQVKVNGDTMPHTVVFSIKVGDIAPVNYVIDGKCVSQYQKNIRVWLPPSPSNRTIEVTRLSPDDVDFNIDHPETVVTSNLYWSFITDVTDHRMIYPNTCYFAGAVDSELFGGNIPRISFRVQGIKVQVPTGYTPPYKNASGWWVAAVYPATWDGTWSSILVPTSNPVWCFRDFVTNKRYGAGLPSPDKWALYTASQYSDELVPTGLNDGRSEPRFTLNCVLQTQMEAYTVINALAAAFRGSTWWGSGKIDVAQDSPKPVVAHATLANVKDGLFTYEGSALKARHTSAMVTWNNPDNNFLPEIEPVEDIESILTYGYRPSDLVPLGVTTQGLAHRTGAWKTETETNETELASYAAGLDHAFVRPGMLIDIADPFHANVRMGGRVVSVSGTTAQLDAPVTLTLGQVYELSCTLSVPTVSAADGFNETPKVETRTVTTTSDGLEHTTLELASAFSSDPTAGSVWVLSGDVAPRPFTVLSNTESEGWFNIIALEHDPTKFDRVETGLNIEKPSYGVDPQTGLILPAGTPQVTVETYYTNSGLKTRLVFSWIASSDPRVSSYEVEYKLGLEGSYSKVEPTGHQLYERDDVQIGTHYFRVRAVSATFQSRSDWVEGSIVVANPAMPDVTGLKLTNQSNIAEWTADPQLTPEYFGGGPKFSWTPVANSVVPTSGGVDSYFDRYRIDVYDYNYSTVLRTDYTLSPEYEYTYEKNVFDNGGTPVRATAIRVYQMASFDNASLSPNPAELSVNNPPPTMAGFAPIVTSVSKGIAVSWASWVATDTDFTSFDLYVEETPDPLPVPDNGPTLLNVTLPGVTRRTTIRDLTIGTPYRVMIVPRDTFGAGIPSTFPYGTPLVIDGADVNVELTESITMLDSDSNSAATLLKLYDRNTISDGVPYTVSGAEKYIQYFFAIESYIDRVVIHTADANTQAYIRYSVAGDAWNYLSAQADHDLPTDVTLIANTQAVSRTNFWQLSAGRNTARFPQRATAKYCELVLVGTYTTEIYELVFSREVIAEMVVADTLAALATKTGKIFSSEDFQTTPGKPGFLLDGDTGEALLKDMVMTFTSSTERALVQSGLNVGDGADKTSSNTAASISGQGSLATSNSANYSTQISGTKPPSDADKTSTIDLAAQINANTTTIDGDGVTTGTLTASKIVADDLYTQYLGTGGYYAIAANIPAVGGDPIYVVGTIQCPSVTTISIQWKYSYEDTSMWRTIFSGIAAAGQLAAIGYSLTSGNSADIDVGIASSAVDAVGAAVVVGLNRKTG